MAIGEVVDSWGTPDGKSMMDRQARALEQMQATNGADPDAEQVGSNGAMLKGWGFLLIAFGLLGMFFAVRNPNSGGKFVVSLVMVVLGYNMARSGYRKSELVAGPGSDANDEHAALSPYQVPQKDAPQPYRVQHVPSYPDPYGQSVPYGYGYPDPYVQPSPYGYGYPEPNGYAPAAYGQPVPYAQPTAYEGDYSEEYRRHFIDPYRDTAQPGAWQQPGI